MSIICGLPLLECVYCLACARWAWKRCLHTAGHDSETWGIASAEEFEPVPRLCRYLLAVYEDDLRQPLWEPPGGGLNLAKESDYAVLLDNKLGKRKFDGGYVHNGLWNAAKWVLDAECEVLKDLVEKYPNYTLTLTGHSLGAGVAALLTMVVVQNQDKLGHIERKRIRCYAIAPARCMSLNVAVRYADVINSVVLQDDFLPRTATPLEDIFKSLFWMGRFPPVVRTAVPVDGRFEHIVLSCNATSDHAIIWIEREAQRALDLMLEKDRITEIPEKQRMERQKTLVREHTEEYKAALQRAVTLDVPHAFSPKQYGTFDVPEEGEHSESDRSIGESSLGSSEKSRKKESWNEITERLLDKEESGHIVIKKSHMDD
ncbi:hypothetical protein CIPAW_06G002500 [Carya illinoinensis]|uniref:Uncharacterized protein n=1 Tax=Carya illinoinensis TaxID=32201 RepID=A0A8T1Q5Q8_CARIL|nr:hypothetical protein CIPAW_06G002500 [Carya illinoinensis]